MSRRLRKWPKRILLLLIVLGVAWWLHATVQNAVYAPDRNVASTPANVGLPFEDITVQTPDGISLTGWFVPAGNEKSDAATRTHPTAVFFHSRTGSIATVLPKIKVLRDAGLNVLAFDYRGFGKSDGFPSEAGLNLDALAIYFYLTGKLGAASDRIFFYGEGLGGAVAARLATQVSAAGLIIEGGITSMQDLLELHPSVLPWQYLLFRNRFDTVSSVRHIHMPLLLFHSRDDEIVPYRHAERLLYFASDPKELVPISGAHDATFAHSVDVVREHIAAFVAKAGTHEQPAAHAGQTS